MRRRKFLQGSVTLSLCSALAHNRILPAQQQAVSKDSDANLSSDQRLAGAERGPWRRLFLDAAVIQKQQGLKRVFYQATKLDANPVVKADREWEGKSAITGPYVYGTIMRQDDKFRMWYQLLFHGNHVGYAESPDGIHWTKPELDVVKFENGRATNLVVSALEPDAFEGVHCHNPSLLYLPDASDPARRYALYGFDSASRGPRVAYSADGIHFKYVTNASDGDKPKPLFESSDVVSFFYDPYERRYCSTWKTRNRRGRAVGVAVSADGQQWNKVWNGPVFVPDDHDPDETQVYGMPVFAYQGMYIGLPWIYAARYFRYGEYSVDKLHEAQSDSPRTIAPQLAWSWDLVNWTRPVEREPIIALGERGQWDHGMIVTARAPVVVQDELWFYYGGTDKVHDEPQVKAAIGLAKMRLDGFCSMSNRAQSNEGWLITRREPMSGPGIVINGRTGPEGSITAEIIDRKNRVVPGFSRTDCLSFRGDSVSHALRWKADRFPGNAKGQDYKLRFWLQDAELFSYLPTELDPTEPDLARFPATGP